MATPDQLAEDSESLYVATSKALMEQTDETGVRSKTFSQDDLLSFGIVTDIAHLGKLAQRLASMNLFRLLLAGGKPVWSVRSREAAKQISALDPDSKKIYSVIEEAHTEGIWLRVIRMKAKSVAPNMVTKVLGIMESKRLIKSVKSVKNTAQKTFMLYHLSPSEEVTGNSFFDAGDLDESFRDELMNLMIWYVRQNSWVEVRQKPKIKREEPSSPIRVDDSNPDSPDTAQTTTSNKRKRTADIEDAGTPPARPAKQARPAPSGPLTQIPYRASTHHYPTASDILGYLADSPAIMAAKRAALTQEEIQLALDILVWDEKLERLANAEDIAVGYRTVRGVAHVESTEQLYGDLEGVKGTALTQAPCGRCPVFDLCRPGGPVEAAECGYFDDWLRA